MTRINSTGNSGPQPIPSQDSAAQNVSPTQNQKTKQEPSASGQQQSKQAAQGRKNEMDLQGTIKQSELAEFHGPGRIHRDHTASKNQKHDEHAKEGTDGTHRGPNGRLSEAEVMERQWTELHEMIKAFEDEKKHPGLNDGLDVLEKKDSRKRAEERAGKEIADNYFPKKESNTSKKTE
jgi:hypothetical protein